MSKLTVIDQMQRTLEFVRSYAETHPDFKQELEAALASAVPTKPKTVTPHEYVAEYGLPAFKEHVETAELETLTIYARRLKIKVSRAKNPPLDDLRRSIVSTMQAQLEKGSVFAQHG